MFPFNSCFHKNLSLVYITRLFLLLSMVSDDSLISLAIVSKFRFYYWVNLSVLINIYSPWNHMKTKSFLLISGKIEVNKGEVIFNAGYQGGRKLPGVSKLQQLGPRGMKSLGRPRLGYENLFNNSSKRPRGAKTAGQFFMGYETF